jgi:hypothetical protein
MPSQLFRVARYVSAVNLSDESPSATTEQFKPSHWAGAPQQVAGESSHSLPEPESLSSREIIGPSSEFAKAPENFRQSSIRRLLVSNRFSFFAG